MTFEAIQGWSDSQIPGDYKVRDPEKAAEALLFSRSTGYLEVVWLKMANCLVVYTRRPVEPAYCTTSVTTAVVSPLGSFGDLMVAGSREGVA